jgi:aminoglycoside phosphotransferase (APT) family kinase protein
MSSDWLVSIPEAQRVSAREAVASAFGTVAVTAIEPVMGGASGALAYRIELGARRYLLRIETHRSPLRNPHQYACMQIAADAGLAPGLHYTNDGAGTAVMDFVEQKPLSAFPGGQLELVKALGKLTARLQVTTLFPTLAEYRAVVRRIFTYLRGGAATGLLDPHQAALEQICTAYRWDDSKHTSSHNDPNPRNILFDGERLWLIDWETSYRNDPLTDIAILTDNLANTPDLEDIFLHAWRGIKADQGLKARLHLMRLMTKLWYAGMLLAPAVKAGLAITELAAPTPDEFRSLLASGKLSPTAPETRVLLGKMVLAAFHEAASAPKFSEMLAAAQD